MNIVEAKMRFPITSSAVYIMKLIEKVNVFCNNNLKQFMIIAKRPNCETDVSSGVGCNRVFGLFFMRRLICVTKLANVAPINLKTSDKYITCILHYILANSFVPFLYIRHMYIYRSPVLVIP